ncbi:MAG: hypothetical protein V3G42_03290 [Oscillospiraceae bacterium]
MSRLKRITAGLTALALSLSLTACGTNTRTALTVDGYEVPAGVYIYYLNTAYSNAVSQLSEENSELDTTDKEAIKNLTLEGKDVTTWIQDKATEMVTDFVATEKKFDELGLSLDADTKSNISSMKEYYWASNQETFENNGISEDSFTKILTSSYKSDEVFKYYYGIDGQEGVTEDDLKQYYIDNNIRCQFINMSLKDSEGNLMKSEEKAEMMEMLEGYRDRVQKAYDKGGEESAREEMDAVTDEYNAYVASLSEEAEADSNSDVETDSDVEADTSAEEETTADSDSETTAEEENPEENPDEEADTSAEDENAENEDSDETTTEVEENEEGETAEVQDDALSAPIVQQILTAENNVEADDSSAEETVAEEETSPEEETTAGEQEENPDNAETPTDEEPEFVPDYDVESEDSLPEEEISEESAEDGEIAVTSNEDGAEDDTLDIGGEADAPTFPNETIVRVVNPDDYDDPADIYYNPSEKVYNQLVDIKEADYGKPYIVEEDENYYLVVRYDITERMTDTDLWTDTAIDNADYQAHSKDFEDLMDSWTNTSSIAKNEAAYHRYDPFKLDF